ncbi:ABC transporter permease [Chryseolinea lacunae]|uniref:ABC transporter permease n=1 Tax=Chryseolinea lacunae TaxID=2801331 RepID=A0ABS1L204_9BACT|nr:ABC transporter permease [Chryseolinea lacunae]MBL0745684.1 ABC transporter permease [Chryseolinea lacunae]
MLKNYALLFVRNLKRQKLFSSINLLGLTVSMASTMLIYLYVKQELTFDNFHPHSDRLYRVNQTFIWSDNRTDQFSRTGPGVAHALIEELPEVEITTSLHTAGDFIVSYEKTNSDAVVFEETRVLSADTNFFKVLNFPLILGDEATAFSQANTMVMTRSTATKYFGTENPIGKMVRLRGRQNKEYQTYEVTGVMADAPGNSTLQFPLLLSSKGFAVDRMHWSWVWTQLETFVRLYPGADIHAVREKINTIPRKRAEESIKAAMGMTYAEYIASGKKWELFLQPINTLHLPEYSVVGSFPDTGDRKIIYSFIGAALFIVLLSCINFMNLSTAQFTRRIKEASIRKILGLAKKELALGYFFEALGFCMIALVVAVAISQAFLPAFNSITGKHLVLSLFTDRWLVVGALCLTIMIALISASYPALFLTTFHPVAAIKGRTKVGRTGKSFRDVLVVFQFCVSIILIIATAVVFQQLRFISEKDLGFDKENLVVLHHVEHADSRKSLARDVAHVPGAIDASWCASAPPFIYGGDSFSAEGKTELKFPLNYTSGDENYLPTLGIPILLGRNFDVAMPADSNRVIVNEATIRRIGWPLDESVLGKNILYPTGQNTFASFEIVGVVKDFNYWSVESVVEPLGIFHMDNKILEDDAVDFAVVKVVPQSSEAWQNTLVALQKVWKQHAGNTPFQYSFLDQNFESQFARQQQFGKILSIMSSLAILIAGLGLLGMIVYSLEQRTKEIGVRKVVGASVYNILVLISAGYTKLIVIAFLIGAPVAYWMTKIWLQDFPEPVKPSMWIFLATGAGTLLLAMIITGYHALKAAATNPVDVLKDE